MDRPPHMVWYTKDGDSMIAVDPGAAQRERTRPVTNYCRALGTAVSSAEQDKITATRHLPAATVQN